MRFQRLRRSIVPGLAVLALAACNDEPDFGNDEWDIELDTVTLYTVDRPDYQGLPAAYDIRLTNTVRVEDAGSTGNWDFVLTGGGDEPLALTPIGAFFNVGNNAGFAISDDTFEEIENAPSANSAYVTDEPTTIEMDAVYVVRSRTGNCLVFAKLEPLEIDQEAGTFTFHAIRNPLCNDTALIPPED